MPCPVILYQLRDFFLLNFITFPFKYTANSLLINRFWGNSINEFAGRFR